MFIGSVFLKELLSEYEINSYIGGVEHCIVGVEMLSNAIKPYHKHILYIVSSPEELEIEEPQEDMFLLVFNPEKQSLDERIKNLPPSANLLEVCSDEKDAVCLQIRNTVNNSAGVGLLSKDILDYLYYNSSIQDMVDDFEKAFQNPIFVFDAGHTIIAGNWDLAQSDEVTKNLAKNKRVTDFEYGVIHGDPKKYNEIMTSKSPIEISFPEFGHKQLVCPIDPEQNLGLISVAAINRPIEETDYLLLEMFRDGVAQRLKMDDFNRNSRGFPYEYFIRDLLDQKVIFSAQFDWQFEYATREFSTNMYLMVVETAMSMVYLNVPFIREELEKVLPQTRTLMYKGEILCIFCLPPGGSFPAAKMEELRNICSSRNLFAGMSNGFSSLKEILAYYKQALRALEIGTAENRLPGLYLYADNSLKHVVSVFLQNENEKIYCHPELKKLIRYDEENGTSFAETLYTYLTNDRSNSKTAQVLFIHKNTLAYRLQKIEDLIDFNMDDYQERMYLILSYELYKASKQ